MTTSVFTRRRIVVGGIVLVAIAAGLLFARNSLSASTETGILTTTVVRGDVEETVLATGTFKPVKLVAVGAQVSGRITALHVKLGEEIKTDALVAEIDSVTQKNSLRTAEAALANVKAQRVEKAATLTNAQLTLDRQKSIYESKAGPSLTSIVQRRPSRKRRHRSTRLMRRSPVRKSPSRPPMQTSPTPGSPRRWTERSWRSSIRKVRR